MKQKSSCPVFESDKSACTGCGACSFICKQHAISMEADSEGFLIPKVDQSLCVECGLCISRCPLNKNNENISNDNACILATTDKKAYYEKSATIGVCTMLSEHVLRQGGVVYGAYLDESAWEVCHIKIENKEELYKIRNSKYAQSTTYHIYKDVISSIKTGVPVLYIGTPCQISGLKSCIFRQPDNLFTIDLICHGVYSNKILQKEVQYWKGRYGEISNFRFRSKKKFDWSCGGVINFDYKMPNGEHGHIERPGCSSPTYYCYAYAHDKQNHNLRQSCYNCNFRSSNRYGDLTVGDSWCINLGDFRKNIFLDNVHGTSLIQINSPKGMQLLNSVKHKLKTKGISKESAYVQPALNPTNRKIPDTRRMIYSSLSTTSEYGAYIERLFNVNFDEEEKKFCKQYQRKKCISTIKRIIKRIILLK